MRPALTGMQEIWHNMLALFLFLVFGITVLILFWGIAVLISKMMRAYLRRRKMNNLLQDIAARTIGVVVFLSGLYIVFHLAGLANVAMTVLGGTGLLGIVLGIAFGISPKIFWPVFF
jgi:small conductance mechanosensitive channel